MSWYNNYYLNSHINPEEIEKYKSNFEVQEEENVNDLEKEYVDSIEKINFLNCKEDLQIYLSEFNSLKLLEEELHIIKLLSKYTLQNNYLDLEFFIKCINILIVSSKILMERLKLPEINHKTKNYTNYIPRCSYKFCNFKDECFYNYSNKTKNVCYQDHYVHHMVNADLIILKDYINQKFNSNNLVIPNKEILKTINTLCFVIEHMFSELKSRCLYLNENEIENEHNIKKT